MKTMTSVFMLFCLLANVSSQNVGVGTTSPNASAKLEVTSNNSGFLLPRMTTAERNAIVSPVTGLMVFDLEKSAFYFFDGSSWLPLLTASSNNIPPIAKSVSDGAAGDSLGWSVSISGNYAIAGAPGDDIGGNPDQGSAYIFFKQNGVWTEQAKLTAADGAVGDAFGFSVSIAGDYAIIGAYKDDGTFADQGSAYIFIRSGTVWTQQQKLIAASPVLDDWFGYAVSISGDYTLVGSPKDDVSVSDQGSAFVFIRSGVTWTQQANLTHASPAIGDFFGGSVSISGDYSAVGAPNKSGGMTTPLLGFVYVFFRTGVNWAGQATLFGTVGAERFGTSISLSGSNLIAGHFRTNGGHDIYTRTGTIWNYQTTINAPGAVAADGFGFSGCITSDYIIGGAPDTDYSGFTNQGAVYLFKKNGSSWVFHRRIDDNAGQINGSFGYSVAMDGFNIIMGAKGKNSKKGEVFFLNVE